MPGCGIRVTNLSLHARERHVREFFAFSGEIVDVQLLPRQPPQTKQSAIIIFTDPSAVETAVVLSGAVIVDEPVDIEELDAGYVAATGEPCREACVAGGG